MKLNVSKKKMNVCSIFYLTQLHHNIYKQNNYKSNTNKQNNFKKQSSKQVISDENNKQ